jgi:hypothetical protein
MNKIFFILFILLIGTICQINTFSIFGVYLFVLIHIKSFNSKQFILILSPLIGIFVLGFIFSFSNNLRDVIRDIFYFLTPILLLLLGNKIANTISLTIFFKYLIFLGLVYSSFYIISFFVVNITYYLDPELMRATIGAGNFLTVLSIFALMIPSGILNFKLPVLIKWVLIFINVFAVILFNTRSYYISILVFLLFFLNSYSIRFRFAFYAFFITSFFSLITLNLNNNENLFLSKTLNTFNEISISSNTDLEDNNSNYRAYETFSGFNTFLAGTPVNIIFGNGFGKLIDLKIEILLGTESWQFIPLVHNGFIYLLVKTGIMGLFLFFLFFYKIYPKNIKNQRNRINNYLYIFIKSLIVCVLSLNYVVNGFFNLELQFLLITLGALISFERKIEKS